MTEAMRSAATCLLVAAALVANPGTATSQRPSRVAMAVFQLQPMRASNGRIAGQIVGSVLAAAIVGWTAWAVVDNPEGSDRRVKGDQGYTPNANTAYAIGSFVGSTVAAYWIGRGDDSRGSLAATALGTAIPSIGLALGRHEPYLNVLGLVVGAPLQAVGGTVGYQLTRRTR
jgi:glycerol uptake facilitator-like aquaporin